MREPIENLQREMSAQGSHFFDQGSVLFFKSRVGPSCWRAPDGSVFFATREVPPRSGPIYSVRYWHKCGPERWTVDTLAGLGDPLRAAPKDMAQAGRLCRALAEGHATAPGAGGNLLAAWEVARSNLLAIKLEKPE